MSDSRSAKPDKSDLEAAKRLRTLWTKREEGLTQQRVAERLDITQGAVSQYLHGKIPLNYRAVLAFAAELDCEPAAIRADLPEQRLVRGGQEAEAWDDVRASAQAVGLGNGVEADEYAEVYKLKFKTGSLQKKRLNPKSLRVFYGKGDSMLPRIRSGDAVLFDEADTKVIDDRVYVIMWRGEFNAKRAELLDGEIYFRADNPAADHNWRKPKRMASEKDPITVIGRVRWIGSWED